MARHQTLRHGATALDGRDADLRTRVAWLYYMEGLTQDSTAEKLEISRIRVLKMLASCRQDGTVQIRVTSKLSGCVALERQLETRFGVREAIVIPRRRMTTGWGRCLAPTSTICCATACGSGWAGATCCATACQTSHRAACPS